MNGSLLVSFSQSKDSFSPLLSTYMRACMMWLKCLFVDISTISSDFYLILNIREDSFFLSQIYCINDVFSFYYRSDTSFSQWIWKKETSIILKTRGSWVYIMLYNCRLKNNHLYLSLRILLQVTLKKKYLYYSISYFTIPMYRQWFFFLYHAFHHLLLSFLYIPLISFSYVFNKK